MIGLIDKLTGGYGTLIAYGFMAAVVAGVLGWTYSAGYSSASAKWEAKYAAREVEIAEQVRAETSRIARANAMARAETEARIAATEARNKVLDERIKELSDEADADPDRDRVCLSDDSRVRINSVR